MYSREELAGHFRALGIVPGDTVMMHASVRAVGNIAGGPDQIHLALKDALTGEGTLMMYASCPSHYDEIGRGHLTAAEEQELLDKLPPFDAETARSQRENGALVEFFRTSPGARVNHHVARFVAWGKHASDLFSTQPWDFAFGHDSALERFVTLQGKILLIGCDHDNVTFLHYAEHVVDIADKRIVTFRVPVLENGQRRWRPMKEFDTATVAHPSWPDRFFSSIVDDYLADTSNPGGNVGDAKSFLLDASGLLAAALRAMKALAKSPAGRLEGSRRPAVNP